MAESTAFDFPFPQLTSVKGRQSRLCLDAPAAVRDTLAVCLKPWEAAWRTRDPEEQGRLDRAAKEAKLKRALRRALKGADGVRVLVEAYCRAVSAALHPVADALNKLA